MSLDTFSRTFHYVTHYTDPTNDIYIPLEFLTLDGYR